MLAILAALVLSVYGEGGCYPRITLMTSVLSPVLCSAYANGKNIGEITVETSVINLPVKHYTLRRIYHFRYYFL